MDFNRQGSHTTGRFEQRGFPDEARVCELDRSSDMDTAVMVCATTTRRDTLRTPPPASPPIATVNPGCNPFAPELHNSPLQEILIRVPMRWAVENGNSLELNGPIDLRPISINEMPAFGERIQNQIAETV